MISINIIVDNTEIILEVVKNFDIIGYSNSAPIVHFKNNAATEKIIEIIKTNNNTIDEIKVFNTNDLIFDNKDLKLNYENNKGYSVLLIRDNIVFK